MTGTTTIRRHVFVDHCWRELRDLMREEGVTLCDLERYLSVSRKIAARALGSPRTSTKAEREKRDTINAIRASLRDPARRERFNVLVAICKIPPDAFRCFYHLIRNRNDASSAQIMGFELGISSGNTTKARAIFVGHAWSELLNLFREEGMSFRDIERELHLSRKMVAGALGGPVRGSTDTEQETREVINAIESSFSDHARRNAFKELVAKCRIPPEAFHCFYCLIGEIDR